MALSSSEKIIDDITGSKNTLREIQTEHMIYQLNSSSDTKKTINILRRDIEKISKAIENARKIAYEKKLASDELKINLAEKKDKVKQLKRELDRAKTQVESYAEKVLKLERESSKMKDAIEKIKEATQDLEEKYIEQYQSDLTSTLVKLTSETAKAHSDLNAAKEMETLALRKLQDMEMDLNKSESYTIDKTNEADRIVSNVSITIDHIVKSYDEMTNVSRDLLKSSTSAHIEHEENFNLETENPPNQEFEESKVSM
jgi:chromosome segregation ATPase